MQDISGQIASSGLVMPYPVKTVALKFKLDQAVIANVLQAILGSTARSLLVPAILVKTVVRAQSTAALISVPVHWVIPVLIARKPHVARNRVSMVVHVRLMDLLISVLAQ